MEIQNYIDKMKELQNIVLNYLENSDDNENNFHNLISYINSSNNLWTDDEFTHFFYFISNISNFHHREPDFHAKIEKIILFYKANIKQILSDSEIINIFKHNKSIILFLFENEIIDFNQSIVDQIIEMPNYQFFLPELKKFIDLKDIENELLEKNPNFLTNFEEKRRNGENENYICSLIRFDLIEYFVSYVNKENYKISSKIPKSIFETNSFLIRDEEPTLIEYAAFFGSTKIIRYLKMNDIELTPSLWLYAIHSNNADLIQFLEENHVKIDNKQYLECFKEAIQCHHNDIADYILNNFLDQLDFNEEIITCIFNFTNFYFFPYNFDQNIVFYNLCYNRYQQLVDLYIKSNESKYESLVILN